MPTFTCMGGPHDGRTVEIPDAAAASHRRLVVPPKSGCTYQQYRIDIEKKQLVFEGSAAASVRANSNMTGREFWDGLRELDRSRCDTSRPVIQPPFVRGRYYVIRHGKLGNTIGCYGEIAGNPCWDIMHLGTVEGEQPGPHMTVTHGPFTIEALIAQAARERRFAAVIQALREENPEHPLLKQFEAY